MTTLVLVVSVSIAISFVCSILEATLLSITHAHVVLLEEQKHPAGKLLVRLRSNIDEPIAAILTLNTIAHTIGASMSGAIALEVFGSRWITAFSVVLTLLILVLSEILPKTIGATFWKQLAPSAAWTLRAMIVAMKPILVPLAWLNRLIAPREQARSTVSRAELEILAEIGRREGTIDQDEWQVMNNIMKLEGTRIGQVMTPRTQVVAVPVTATLAEVQRVMLDEGHLRLPVYGESLDQVLGIVLARDLWKAVEAGGKDLAAVIRKPLFVPSTKPVEDMIREMREQRLKMAVVLDEYGGTAGIVTLEDLIEEIVGEIQDEHELEPMPIEIDDQGDARIDGTVTVDEVNSRFDLGLPADQYETIGGLVFGMLGRIPRAGDEVQCPGAVVRVLAMDGRRIDRVSLRRAAGDEAADAASPAP
ncbi:MAG: hemolysin family protein [Planctomycetota bacterium]